MAKYTIETKKRLIELTEKEHTIRSAAKELGVTISIAQRWIQMYEFHGNEGLLKKSGTYTGEFKIEVVEYMHENHLSIREASAKYGIPSASTLLKWERIYYEKGAKKCPKGK